MDEGGAKENGRTRGSETKSEERAKARKKRRTKTRAEVAWNRKTDEMRRFDDLHEPRTHRSSPIRQTTRTCTGRR